MLVEIMNILITGTNCKVVKTVKIRFFHVSSLTLFELSEMVRFGMLMNENTITEKKLRCIDVINPVEVRYFSLIKKRK